MTHWCGASFWPLRRSQLLSKISGSLGQAGIPPLATLFILSSFTEVLGGLQEMMSLSNTRPCARCEVRAQIDLTVTFVLTEGCFGYALCVSSRDSSFPSSSVWTPEDPLGSRHRPGAPTRRGQQTKWQAPSPLGSSQGPLGPVCLFYSPVLTRVFNFSFTSSVALTFNNTTKICSWQSWFRPQNHSRRRSWLTLSALQAVWSPSALSELGWSGGEA